MSEGVEAAAARSYGWARRSRPGAPPVPIRLGVRMRIRSPRLVPVLMLLLVLAATLTVMLVPRQARAQNMAYWIFVTLPNEDQVAAIDFETFAVTA